mmetsp:Transcript_5471/g.11547  ORF Transcript_5471/g.11547 Transcript_5471/m.11547 type:complete len:215 (-) Transcript_5471:2-646(-)
MLANSTPSAPSLIESVIGRTLADIALPTLSACCRRRRMLLLVRLSSMLMLRLRVCFAGLLLWYLLDFGSGSRRSRSSLPRPSMSTSPSSVYFCGAIVLPYIFVSRSIEKFPLLCVALSVLPLSDSRSIENFPLYLLRCQYMPCRLCSRSVLAISSESRLSKPKPRQAIRFDSILTSEKLLSMHKQYGTVQLIRSPQDATRANSRQDPADTGTWY